MKCPVCGYINTKVTETRKIKPGIVFRRRKCTSCGRFFKTKEAISITDAMFLQKEGLKE